jgi:hypothetical protein
MNLRNACDRDLSALLRLESEYEIQADFSRIDSRCTVYGVRCSFSQHGVRQRREGFIPQAALTPSYDAYLIVCRLI